MVHRYLWLVVLSIFVLLPTKTWFNVPMLGLAILGLLHTARERETMFREGWSRLLLVLFACIWVPMLISTVDAVNVWEAVRKTSSFILFLFAGVAIALMMSRRDDLDKLTKGIFVVATLWCVDALWQFGSGKSLLGYPYEGGRLTGVFYPKFTIGVVLALIAPLYFEGLRRVCRRTPWPALLVVPYALVIVLAGSRASWLSLLIAVAGYALYLWRWSDVPRPSARSLRRSTLILLLAGAVIAWSPPKFLLDVGAVIEQRLQLTVGLLSGDVGEVDEALSWRGTIWKAGALMSADHWFNGVGPRGFRYAYPEYAEEDDIFLEQLDSPPTHPHGLLLEIFVETGAVGLLGYAVFVFLFIRALTRLAKPALDSIFPFALPVVVAMFPLNVHKAFYGNFTASLTWWLIGLCIAAFAAGPTRPAPSSPGGASAAREHRAPLDVRGRGS